MPTFETPTPISVIIDIVGDARITASDRTDTVVDVRPRNAAKAADVKAAEQTVVDCSDGRLQVRTPKHWKRYTPFGGGESVAVTIEVPTGSSLEANTDLGDLHAEGELGAMPAQDRDGQHPARPHGRAARHHRLRERRRRSGRRRRRGQRPGPATSASASSTAWP